MSSSTVAQGPFPPAWLWLILVAALVPLVGVLQPGSSTPAEGIAWYSLLIIAGSIVLTRACRIERQFDFFEPLHMALGFFVIYYPVRVLLAAWLDDDWFDPSQTAIWKALSGSALGFAFFALGYKIDWTRSSARRLSWLDRGWDLNRARVASLALLLLGIAGFVAMRVFGGSLLYFMRLDPDIKGPGEIKAWYYYLLWACLLIQVGALLQLGIWMANGRRAAWTAFYCGLAGFSAFLLARLFAVFSVMMLTLAWHYGRKRIRPLQVCILFVALVVYLGLAGLYREWISPGSELEQAGALVELAGQQDQLVLRYVVANLEELSNFSEVIALTPQEIPYQFGSTFAAAIFKPIPRVLMPSKPLGASALFTQHVTPEAYDDGLVTGLGAWSEWYLNFSWPGIVLGFALLGTISSAVYRDMRRTAKFGRIMLYASFVVVLFTWLRSDFNSAITLGLYYFLPTMVALAYITREGPARRRF
jgi:hypothetical protein